MGLQRISVAAVKSRLVAELQALAKVNGEITARVRKIQRVARRLSRGRDLDDSSKSTSFRLIRACRIALLESEESQTVAQIQGRIERRASFVFLGCEGSASMIDQALEEMAAVGEVRRRDGCWARPEPPEPALTSITDGAISKKRARAQLNSKPIHDEPAVNCAAQEWVPSLNTAAGTVP